MKVEKNMKLKSVYLETSIFSYLTARPSRDLQASAWQQASLQWWEQALPLYEAFISEIVVAEASGGDPEAVKRRLKAISQFPELPLDRTAEKLASQLIAEGGFPEKAEVDALHVAIATVHEVDFFLTWNCRHINNAETKPIIRTICLKAGFQCPEICTPQELLPEEKSDV